MAKREVKVSEQKLEMLVKNWNTKDVIELAQLLGTGESTINYWAGKLRKSMKSNGMTDEQIKTILPARRRAQGNVYDNVVEKLLSSERTPGTRRRKPKEVE